MPRWWNGPWRGWRRTGSGRTWTIGTGWPGVQCLLIRGLERLGDLEAAREVAEAALAELPGDALAAQPERDLLTAALRVAGTRTAGTMIQHAVTLAQANGPLLP